MLNCNLLKKDNKNVQEYILGQVMKSTLPICLTHKLLCTGTKSLESKLKNMQWLTGRIMLWLTMTQTSKWITEQAIIKDMRLNNKYSTRRVTDGVNVGLLVPKG